MKYVIIVSAAAVILAASALCSKTVTAQETRATVLFTRVLCKEPNRYIGWPSVAKTKDGDLIAVFSGDRDEHICPWGKTQMVRSSDGGETWSDPVTVNNTPLDDRDAGVIVTRKRTVIVSWFTSLAFDEPNYQKYYPAELTATWRRHAEKLGPEIRKDWLGCWVRRSEDGGRTWGDFIRLPVNAPHGPIELSDGRLLYVGKRLWDDPQSLDVCESRDDGRTWKTIGTIAVAPGENLDHYHELHAVELKDGKIIAMIRYNPPERDNNIMRQAESTDGGRTWSVPHPTGIWGYPPHLVGLDDGRVVVVYGYRREPFGERACVSYDGCKTWDVEHPVEIMKAMNGDLGYPASVVLDDGSLLTVYYQIDKEGEKTCLMGTCWRLE
jgi:hypothetical protein